MQDNTNEMDKLNIQIDVENMPEYYKCNMTKVQHIAAYIVASLLVAVIAWLFYHMLIPSVIIGFVVGVPAERMYAASTTKKRQALLRKQFCDFLEAMSVASRAGQTEVHAVEAALKDLVISYNKDADIVREVEYIRVMNQRGGRKLQDLFAEFGRRSGLKDAQNFAEIYAVIAGKSDRFAEILGETQEILKDKMEIEQEILTTISGAKSEAYIMLVIPIILVVMMSAMGSGLTESLFTTAAGHLSATVALVIFGISFVMAMKFCDVDV